MSVDESGGRFEDLAGGRHRPSMTHRSKSPGVRHRRRFGLLARVAAMAVLVAGAGSFIVGKADSAQAAGVNYVALGDSYSSGVGAGAFDSNEASCKRSANSYSQRWVKEFSAETVANFTFVACSGAKTADVESKQLSSLSTSTTMVTMSIGGNDVGFAPVVELCLLGNLFDENLCIASSIAAGREAEKTMPAKLDALYKKIKQRAPSAKVFILGYPHIFEQGDCGSFGLSDNARKAINSSTSALNRVISKAATANGFTFVDGEQAFAGRGVCSTAPGGAWLTDTSAGTELYHPNANGHEAYAIVLDAAVRGDTPIVEG